MADSLNKQYGTVLLKSDIILQYMFSLKKPASLDNIATNTAMSKSTAHKILSTMIELNYVKKNADKSYLIGHAFLKYASKYVDDFNIVDISNNCLEKLHKQYNETVHLGMLEHDEIVYINKFVTTKNINLMTSRIGMTIPLYRSAMGKAVLSQMSPEKIEQYIDRNDFISSTHNTITDKSIFKQELLNIKKTSIAYDNEENEKDIFCVATSIICQNQSFCAISISMPKYRLTKELLSKLEQSLLNCKHEIETITNKYFNVI